MANVFDFPSGAPPGEAGQPRQASGAKDGAAGAQLVVTMPIILSRYLMLLQGVSSQIENGREPGRDVSSEACLVMSGLLASSVAALDLLELPEWAERFQRALDDVFSSECDIQKVVADLSRSIALLDPNYGVGREPKK
jgi:hypothetical protein